MKGLPPRPGMQQSPHNPFKSSQANQSTTSSNQGHLITAAQVNTQQPPSTLSSRGATSSKSVGPKKVYTPEELQQMEEKLAEVWKTYGRDKEVGRDLYKLYGRGFKPDIDVPVPKTKPWDWKMAGVKEKKPCPQTTKIEYPKVVTKQDILRQQMRAKITKLDLIPKRKNFADIQLELAELKREKASYIPKVAGVDRGRMITNLQDKFKYAREPKGPSLTEEEELKIQQAVEAQMRQASKKNYFGTQGLVPERPVQGKLPEGKAEQFESEHLAELDELFDAVMREIEDRQHYLAEIQDLDMEDAKEKVKQEIVSRVAELQKINKMIKTEKDRLQDERAGKPQSFMKNR